MPAARKSSTQRPKVSSRVVASAPPSLTANKITVRNVAYGFAAINLMFVMFILLLLEVIGTQQILLAFAMRALVPTLIFNAGGVLALLLLLWVIKGYTEARSYGLAVGFLLQLCLVIYLYPLSKSFSLIASFSVFATIVGVVNHIFSRPEKTVRTA